MHTHYDRRYPAIDTWKTDQNWLSIFEASIADFNVVSFDVFDTALTRNLETPVDVFCLVEDTLIKALGDQFEGYANKREQAEQKARFIGARENRTEITFKDIFDVIVGDHPEYAQYRSQMESHEIEAEHASCFAVPEIVAAINLCISRNIRVVFVSDMYLSEHHIRSLLKNAGYTPLDDLLVSSETGCTKADGSQWALLTDLCGPDAKILHVGDNDWSDVKSPRQAGLAAMVFKRARSPHRPGALLTPDILPYSRLNRAVTLSTPIEKLDASTPHDTIQTLGSSWGAIVAGSYVRWIAQRATSLGLSHLYFCARDGQLTQRAWHAAGLDKQTQITSSYLYISRRALNFGAAAISCRPTYLSPHTLDILCNVFRKETLSSILNRADLTNLKPLVDDAIKTFGSLECVITPKYGVPELKHCMSRHSRLIYAHLVKFLENAQKYLCQEGLHKGRVGIVDIGWHGSMQASIANILDNAGHQPQLYGLYAGLWSAAKANRARAGWLEGAFSNDYMRMDQLSGLHNAVAILENSFSAKEGTTLGYQEDGQRMYPVLAECEIGPKQFDDLIFPFQSSTTDAIQRIFAGTHSSGVTEQDLTCAAGSAAIDRLALSPTMDEIKAFGSIQHSGDPSHAHLEALVQEIFPGAKINPEMDLSQSDWPIGSALAAVRNCKDLNQRSELAANIRRQIQHYDHRTLSQFS